MTVAPDALTALRCRLHEIRDELVERMAADGVEPAFLYLIAGVQAALGAIDTANNSAPGFGASGRAECNTAGRAQRNSGMRDIAQLLGAELSLERKAQLVIAKSHRYQPSPSDLNGSPERQALHRIASSGVPVPSSKKQVKRIIAKKWDMDIQ